MNPSHHHGINSRAPIIHINFGINFSATRLPQQEVRTDELALVTPQGAYTTFALCGFIRQSGGADAALLRLWEKKQGSEGRS
jgi:hypothetical protein